MEIHEDEASDVVVTDLMSFKIKVHNSVCNVLKELVKRVTQLLPLIEAYRPGGTAGIQALCSVNQAVEKAKLLLEHCADSSKLFLAIKGKSIHLRCERIREALDMNLCLIQEMVPQSLAGQIFEVVGDLRIARFRLETSEEKAGQILLSLMHPDKISADLMEGSEFDAFKDVTSTLNLKSSRDILIERRYLQKLYRKFQNTDPRAANVVKYLLYLLKTHGKLDSCKQSTSADTRRSEQVSSTLRETPCALMGESLSEPSQPKIREGCQGVDRQDEMPCCPDSSTLIPQEFRCPISLKVMYDPVLISSGKSYERFWIEKWFNAGHDTCPTTQKILPNLSFTPNSYLKNQISNWCIQNGVTVPDPRTQPIPALFLPTQSSGLDTSVSSFSVDSLNKVPSLLLERKAVEFLKQKDLSNVSIGSSSVPSCSLDYSLPRVSHDDNFVSKDLMQLLLSWNSDERQAFPSFFDLSTESYATFLSILSQLPSELQKEVLQNFKNFVKENADASCLMTGDHFLDALIRHLKDAHTQPDLKALKAGSQTLLIYMANTRQLTDLPDDAFQLLAKLVRYPELSSEVLEILQLSTDYQHGSSLNIVSSGALHSIVKNFDLLHGQALENAVQIICSVSNDDETRSQLISSGCVAKIISCLAGGQATSQCLKILRSLCEISEETQAAIVETDGCLASIAERLDTETPDEQEWAVALLYSLCSSKVKHVHLVMKEGIIPALVHLTVNGTYTAREMAQKLLMLLRDVNFDDNLEDSPSQVGSTPELPRDFSNSTKAKQLPVSRTSGFFKNKFKFISRPKTSPLF